MVGHLARSDLVKWFVNSTKLSSKLEPLDRSKVTFDLKIILSFSSRIFICFQHISHTSWVLSGGRMCEDAVRISPYLYCQPELTAMAFNTVHETTCYSVMRFDERLPRRPFGLWVDTHRSFLRLPQLIVILLSAEEMIYFHAEFFASSSHCTGPNKVNQLYCCLLQAARLIATL
jgi:hypothetical protein